MDAQARDIVKPREARMRWQRVDAQSRPVGPRRRSEPHPAIPRWLPNLISAVRIALVPVWLAIAINERHRALEGDTPNNWLVLGLLAAVGLSDMIDGQLARRFGLATNLGAMLDAVADKLASFVAVTFLAFAAEPAFAPLPLWLWGALFLRDLLLGIGWLMVRREHQKVEVEHQWHGRLSTLILFFTVLAACAHAPSWLILGGSVAVLALIVPGTVVYMREGWRQLKAPGSAAAMSALPQAQTTR